MHEREQEAISLARCYVAKGHEADAELDSGGYPLTTHKTDVQKPLFDTGTWTFTTGPV